MAEFCQDLLGKCRSLDMSMFRVVFRSRTLSGFLGLLGSVCSVWRRVLIT